MMRLGIDRNLSLSFLTTFLVQLSSFFFLYITSRNFTAEIAGDYAKLIAFYGVVSMISEGGLGASIIRSKSINRDVLSSLFWTLSLTSLVAVLTYITMMYVAMSELMILVYIFSVSVIIRSLTIVPKNIITRQLGMKELLIIESVPEVLSVSIVFILFKYYNDALVLASVKFLISAIATLVFAFYFSRFNPLFKWRLQDVKEHYKFGSFLTLSSVTARFYDLAIVSIISSVFGKAYLGFFSRGSSISKMPSTAFQSALSRYAFPLFSSLQDRPDLLVQRFKRFVYLGTGVSLLLSGFIIAYAEHIVALVLGEGWNESIEILRILVLSILFYSQSALALNVIKALGKGSQFFKIEILKTVISITILIFGAFIFENHSFVWSFVPVSFLGLIINLSVLDKILFRKFVIRLILFDLLISLAAVSWVRLKFF
jgi:teichuronic acid exporter